ncbi:MAG: MFS transporter [Thermoplasmatales archaeon]
MSNQVKDYFAILRKPTVARLFFAELFDNIAMASYMIALSIVVYSRVPNTLILGVLIIMPAIASLLAPLIGHIVDSHYKKKIIFLVRSFDVFIFAGLGYSIALANTTFVIIFAILAFVIEINNGLRKLAIGTIFQIFLKKSEETVRLRSLDNTIFWVTYSIMPAIIGFLIAHYGDVYPFILIALLIIPQIILYSFLKFEEDLNEKPNTKVWQSLKSAYSELGKMTKTNPVIFLIIIVPLIHAFFTSANYVLIVALVYRFHNFAIDYGIISSLGVASNAIGSFISGIVKLQRGLLIILLFVMTFGLDIPVGLHPTFLFMIIFLSIGGGLYFIVSTYFGGLRLVLIKREYYGRIRGIIGFLNGISTVSGTLILTYLATVIPPRLVYLYSVTALTIVTASLLIMKKIRTSEVPPSK